LEQALSEIVRRHEVLRTSIEVRDGKSQQVVTPPYSAKVSIIDLSEVEAGKRENLAIEIARREANASFDLGLGPLFRTKLVRMQQHEHLLLVTMHHIISDLWSIGVFEREIGTLYEVYRTGHEGHLAELEIQYADYAAWQIKWLQGEVLEKQ